jgi:hypothetical protein
MTRIGPASYLRRRIRPNKESSMTVRLPAVAAVLAGLLAILEGLVQLGYTQPDSGWGPSDLLFEVGFALSLLASVVALHGVPTRLRSGRASRVGAVVAQLGFGVLLITAVASAIARQNALQSLFPVGLLLVLVGLLALGIAGAVTGEPRWLAMVPFAGFLLSVVLPAPVLGDGALGIAWLVVGALMGVPMRRARVLA